VTYVLVDPSVIEFILRLRQIHWSAQTDAR